MGFPSFGTESLYRNSYEDVYQFLEKRHQHHYYIYNLCSERKYEAKLFHNRVFRFPFDDHAIVVHFKIVYIFVIMSYLIYHNMKRIL